MTKTVKIAVILFLILDVTFIVFLAQNNIKIIKENERLIGKNKEMSDKVVEMLADEDVQVLERECEFTQTYRVIDNLKYTSASKYSKFVLVDRALESKPLVLEYKDFTFEKNKNYEITFRGIANTNIKEYKIIEAKETTKVGSEQLQEKCE